MSLPKRIVGYKLLVRPEQAQERSHGGIIIPKTANADTEQGIVMMVSEHILHIEVGDRVIYPSHAGVTQEYDGIIYKYLNGPVKDNPGDIMAII